MKVFGYTLPQLRGIRLNLLRSITNKHNIFSINKAFFTTSNDSNNNSENPKTSDSSPGPSSNHCNKENCGCHSSTPEDSIEQDLRAKNYNIIECINAGKYDEALDLSDDFINTVKSNYGEDHPFYCSALNNKAFILKTCGQFDEAKSLFEEVIDKYKQTYGDNNEKVVITMHNLATLHKDAKEYEKSLDIYEKILKKIEKENIHIEGEKTGKLRLNIIANIYNSAGGLYRQIKNFQEGDRLFNLAYSIIKENFGEKTLPIATVLNNMALSLKDQGKFQEAMEKYTQALEIRNSLLNQDHPDIVMIKHNIEQLKNEMASKNSTNPDFNNKI